LSRWNKEDKDDLVFEPESSTLINPLCNLCAERVDASMTTRKDIICFKEVKPEIPDDVTERMYGTIYKCKKFNPIDDVMVRR
jgi:CBS domain containing-hemolysin-like protein